MPNKLNIVEIEFGAAVERVKFCFDKLSIKVVVDEDDNADVVLKRLKRKVYRELGIEE